jgi:GNAT superfamily N-acetyltransferase
MPASELDHEIAAGVSFLGYDSAGSLIGVMGIQPVDDVDLIRHAYVMPGSQGRGVGAELLKTLRLRSMRPMLVGDQRSASLLRRYWNIPDRQIATSVVLANPPLDD